MGQFLLAKDYYTKPHQFVSMFTNASTRGNGLVLSTENTIRLADILTSTERFAWFLPNTIVQNILTAAREGQEMRFGRSDVRELATLLQGRKLDVEVTKEEVNHSGHNSQRRW